MFPIFWFLLLIGLYLTGNPDHCSLAYHLSFQLVPYPHLSQSLRLPFHIVPKSRILIPSPPIVSYYLQLLQSLSFSIVLFFPSIYNLAQPPIFIASALILSYLFQLLIPFTLPGESVSLLLELQSISTHYCHLPYGLHLFGCVSCIWCSKIGIFTDHQCQMWLAAH